MDWAYVCKMKKIHTGIWISFALLNTVYQNTSFLNPVIKDCAMDCQSLTDILIDLHIMHDHGKYY